MSDRKNQLDYEPILPNKKARTVGDYLFDGLVVVGALLAILFFGLAATIIISMSTGR